MNRPTAIALSLTTPLLLVACSEADGADPADPAADGTITVVASTNVWGDVAAQVGGDRVAVTSIISDPTQDPHGFEADADTLLEVADAEVIVANGGGYDDFVETLVDSSGTSAPVIDAFETSGLADLAPEGEEVNEHVWYDVPTVGKVATAIADELGKADPDHADDYTANADAFLAELEGLELREAELSAQLTGTSYALTEPLPVYLAGALGLEDATPEEFAESVEEGEDVPAAALQETLDLFAGDAPVAVLLYNEQTATPVTEQVRDAAETADVPVVPVTELLPEGSDYVAWQSDNIDAIAAALGAS